MKAMTTLTTLKLLFLSTLIFMSCGRVDTLFDIATRVDMIIPAGSNTFEILGLETQAVFPYEVSLASRGLSPESIDRVISREAIFRPIFSATDLDFINVIEVNVVDPNDPTNMREVFYLDPIPLGPKREIELRPSLPNIRDFIYEGDKLLFQVELTFRNIPTTNVDVRIDMEFGVIAEE